MENKLTALCEDYDMKVRRIAILERELEQLKHETRLLHDQMEKEL